MRYYTGVGSRETPAVILDLMREVACKLAYDGYNLRSGGADGADLAFQKGWVDAGCAKSEIYIPWDGFNDFDHDGKTFYALNRLGYQFNAAQLAAEIHPVWDRLSRGAQALHTRNVYQVLGQELDSPSDFLICYAKPTKTGVSGGTNTAVQVAIKFGTPVYNMYHEEVVKRFEAYVS